MVIKKAQSLLSKQIIYEIQPAPTEIMILIFMVTFNYL